MARWYDGYLIGPDPEPIHVYNPNSVARAIGSGHFSNYWTSTETYEALRVYIDMDFDGVQQDLVAMLDGQHVAADVSTFDNTMTGVGSRDEIYALLVHLGYLGYDEDDESVFIPNEEIRREFRTAIRTGARPELARTRANRMSCSGARWRATRPWRRSASATTRRRWLASPTSVCSRESPIAREPTSTSARSSASPCDGRPSGRPAGGMRCPT